MLRVRIAAGSKDRTVISDATANDFRQLEWIPPVADMLSAAFSEIFGNLLQLCI